MSEADDELYHLALAAYMLEAHDQRVDVLPFTLASWRRGSIDGEWNKRLPLYLWITVKPS